MNHDGSDPRLLTQSGDASPAWSRDGTRIAFNRNGVIHVMAPDGTGVTPLVPANGPMRWSPDDSRLTFTGFDGQVWTVAADGTDLRRITDLATDTGAPDYTPDGLAILFHSPRVSPEARIWIVNTDGSGLRLLEGIAQAGAVHASWFAP
jgi:TolB protein